MRSLARILLGLCLLVPVAAHQGGVSAAVKVAAQPATISYWGMNAYITKRERIGRDNFNVLADTAKSAGVQWTREELPWDLIEPANNDFRSAYDGSLRLTAAKGFGIIGMLLTTPAWARDPACHPAGPAYWCPPADVNEFAQFAGWMTERYDGDGLNDAPGSPRIAAWEIWNEPNDTLLWPLIAADSSTSNDPARKRRYGEMLVAAHQAIKAADASAKVLIGGVYVYDGSYCEALCDGLVFLDGVFQQVAGAREAFDVLAIHPFIPTVRPDAPSIPRLITIEGRIRSTRARLDNSYGRPDAPIWITEIGWCTEGTCPGGVQVSEDQQANYLIRSMVVAQQNGVQHTSWFQFEDAFNDLGREWAGAAIVRSYDGSGYAPKAAYYAYRTLAQRLAGAAVTGTGPVHTHVYDPSQPYVNDNGIYDYQYTRGSTTIDVLWKARDSATVAFPIQGGKRILQVDRNGSETELVPQNNSVSVVLTEEPFFIVQSDVANLVVSPAGLTLLAQTGSASASTALSITNSGGAVLAWQIEARDAWISVERTSGLTPDTIKVTATTSGRTAGTFDGSLTLRSDGVPDMIVPVRVVIADALYPIYLPQVRR